MDLELLQKINLFKYKISDMSINCLASKITIDFYEYVIYASDTNELNNKNVSNILLAVSFPSKVSVSFVSYII